MINPVLLWYFFCHKVFILFQRSSENIYIPLGCDIIIKAYIYIFVISMLTDIGYVILQKIFFTQYVFIMETISMEN